jgi:DinB family protein
MALDWKQMAIDQLDWYWQTLFRPRLAGLTDDEYFWEPVPDCWSIRPRSAATTKLAAGKGDLVIDFEYPESTPTPFTTIAWRLGHIGSGVLGFRADNHFGTGAPSFDQVEWPASAEAAVAYLDDGYDRWVAGVRSLDEEGLARPVGPAEGPYAERPFAELILHISREVMHHGAEIALLRDLYLHRFGRSEASA